LLWRRVALNAGWYDTHAKITLRHLGAAPPTAAAPLTGDEIRALRENAKLSQAVFARYPNLTARASKRYYNNLAGHSRNARLAHREPML
jgi:hypothetical protein